MMLLVGVMMSHLGHRGAVRGWGSWGLVTACGSRVHRRWMRHTAAAQTATAALLLLLVAGVVGRVLVRAVKGRRRSGRGMVAAAAAGRR